MNKVCKLLLLCTVLLSACDKAPEQIKELQYSEQNRAEVTVYSLAIHPLHNPRKLSEAYQPLVDYLNKHIDGARVELESSRDYQAYEEKFRARTPHILLPNPWQTLEAIKVGYSVIAMAGDATDFKGIFIVRKDRGLKNISQIKNNTVSYPSPTALAACIMPQYFLHTNGININTDIKNIYVGSQESSIMNVYLGKTIVGATWPPPWRLFQKDHPQEAEQLEVIWETPSLMNNSFMIRDDIPANIRQQISQLIHELNDSVEGLQILESMETARIHPANNFSYAKVRDYIQNFEKEVRPVETP